MVTRREQWPAEEACARAIVAALGQTAGGWGLVDGSGSPEEWHAWRAVREADGLTIGFDWPDRYGSGGTGDRITISLIFPQEPGNGPRVVPRTPYGQSAPTTAITVAATKTPTQIAVESLRRLVGPCEPLHAEAVRLIAERQAAGARQQAAITRILDAERQNGAHVSRNGGGSSIYFGSTTRAYAVQVNGDQSVRFEAFSCGIDQALRVLEALRVEAPTTCEQCEAVISATQARVARLRAEGAPAWCADCCSAALTERAEA